jgi:hypothetical protein
VENPNLFNVLITRARRHLIVVTALTTTWDGLLCSPTTWRGAAGGGGGGVPEGWPALLAVELRRQGADVR